MRDYICAPCNRQRDFDRRARRKAEGRPVRPGQPSSDYYKAWSSKPENRLKNATRARTRYAIKHGKLKPLPCEICGALPSEAHHNDYSDHMAVHWLCKTHHEELHRLEARGESA
jgi:hypothetical protein